ncbi:hypothetical protein JCM19231_2683 [Vibrio ishigakensis]|uniref:Uncharacterized protein n=1 Tax=Vibrio ishigakensis TaxID=1481914 RepID=A0A0B8P3K4_9VIBR|nr:hypothetical protein JCM19231_2683 [Vibrio ishigakensis]
MSHSKILVTGASGKLGQAVVKSLLEEIKLSLSSLSLPLVMPKNSAHCLTRVSRFEKLIFQTQAH